MSLTESFCHIRQVLQKPRGAAHFPFTISSGLQYHPVSPRAHQCLACGCPSGPNCIQRSGSAEGCPSPVSPVGRTHQDPCSGTSFPESNHFCIFALASADLKAAVRDMEQTCLVRAIQWGCQQRDHPESCKDWHVPRFCHVSSLPQSLSPYGHRSSTSPLWGKKDTSTLTRRQEQALLSTRR